MDGKDFQIFLIDVTFYIIFKGWYLMKNVIKNEKYEYNQDRRLKGTFHCLDPNRLLYTNLVYLSSNLVYRLAHLYPLLLNCKVITVILF